jgi:hypothetical protein
MLPIENNGLIVKAKPFLSFIALIMGRKKTARPAGGAEAFGAQCIFRRW